MSKKLILRNVDAKRRRAVAGAAQRRYVKLLAEFERDTLSEGYAIQCRVDFLKYGATIPLGRNDFAQEAKK